MLERLEDLNQGEYGHLVCAICTFCILKPGVTLDIVLSQSLSSHAPCIRLMMLWVRQQINQINTRTIVQVAFFKRMKDVLWQQHRKDRNMWADGSRASFGQVSSLNYCHLTWHVTWENLALCSFLFCMALCSLSFSSDWRLKYICYCCLQSSSTRGKQPEL